MGVMTACQVISPTMFVCGILNLSTSTYPSIAEANYHPVSVLVRVKHREYTQDRVLE